MSSVPCRTALRCFDSFGMGDTLPSITPMVVIRLSNRQDMCCEMREQANALIETAFVLINALVSKNRGFLGQRSEGDTIVCDKSVEHSLTAKDQLRDRRMCKAGFSIRVWRRVEALSCAVFVWSLREFFQEPAREGPELISEIAETSLADYRRPGIHLPDSCCPCAAQRLLRSPAGNL